MSLCCCCCVLDRIVCWLTGWLTFVVAPAISLRRIFAEARGSRLSSSRLCRQRGLEVFAAFLFGEAAAALSPNRSSEDFLSAGLHNESAPTKWVKAPPRSLTP